MEKKFIILLLFFLSACCTRKKTTDTIKEEQQPAAVNEEVNWASKKYAVGVVVKSDGIAGCDYIVKLEDESVLEPLNLADSLKKNNLKLWIRFHQAKNQAGICMMGEIVTIDDVKYRK